MSIAGGYQVLRLSSRGQRLAAELRHAYDGAPSGMMVGWARESLVNFPRVTGRRIGNVAKTFGRLAKFARSEAAAILNADNRPGHLRERASRAGAAAVRCGRRLREDATRLYAALRENPREVAPSLAVATLAFFFGSGGPDGDGGVPDLDIDLFGIGGHRSIFTHSIFAGALLETLLLATTDFVRLTHAYLPADHDPGWDEVVKQSMNFEHAANKGFSAGLATHFAVDTVFDAGYYRDLPVSLDAQTHSAIMGANSAMEAMDIRKKRDLRSGAARPPKPVTAAVLSQAKSLKIKRPRRASEAMTSARQRIEVRSERSDSLLKCPACGHSRSIEGQLRQSLARRLGVADVDVVTELKRKPRRFSCTRCGHVGPGFTDSSRPRRFP